MDDKRDAADNQPQENPQQEIQIGKTSPPKATVEHDLVKDDRDIETDERRHEFGF